MVSMRIRQGLVHHRRLVEQVLRDGGAARSVQLQARGRQHAFSSLSPNQVRLMALNSDDYDALLSLDRTVDSTRGADQSGIDQLPEYRVAQSSRALDCAICLEPLGPGSAARILPCLHQFHKECIDLWLRDTCVCPVSRVARVHACARACLCHCLSLGVVPVHSRTQRPHRPTVRCARCRPTVCYARWRLTWNEGMWPGPPQVCKQDPLELLGRDQGDLEAGRVSP